MMTANRQEAISALVELMLKVNLDDVANNAEHYSQQADELRVTMPVESIEEAGRQFAARWAAETHYCSGMPIEQGRRASSDYSA